MGMQERTGRGGKVRDEGKQREDVPQKQLPISHIARNKLTAVQQ